MIIVPFTPLHAMQIVPQEGQMEVPEDAALRMAEAMRMASAGPAWAVMVGADVICIAGVIEQWNGRAACWAVLADEAGPHMLPLTRAVRKYLDGLGYRRLEMYVDCTFGAACRWARMLGFEVEGKMSAFLPSGRDAFMFRRIKR